MNKIDFDEVTRVEFDEIADLLDAAEYVGMCRACYDGTNTKGHMIIVFSSGVVNLSRKEIFRKVAEILTKER